MGTREPSEEQLEVGRAALAEILRVESAAERAVDAACMATPAVRERLAPEVFRLPVERIREGYYSDAYFTYTRELLELEDRHPRVLMQVFQRKESVLGGIDEAIAILKQCAGHDGDAAGTSSRSTPCTRATRSRRGRR